VRQILPHSLWIGHAADGREYRRLLDAGIHAIVQLALEEPALQPPRELVYCRFPLVDGPGNDRKLLGLAVTTAANFLEQRVPLLLCCGGGMSRSPAIAAAALSMVYQQEPDECLKQVAEHHPADVLPGFWTDVKGCLVANRF
jgi:protein-tyrosine phosphatase